jgi:hypothetical protein
MAKHNQPITIQGTGRGSAVVKMTFADIVAAAPAATSHTFAWADLVAAHRLGASSPPINSEIQLAKIVRLDDFSGGGATAVTVGLGDAALPVELMSALDVFTGAKATAALSVGNGVYTLGRFEAAYLPLVLVTSDVNVDVLVAGSLELHIVWRSHEIESRVA